jgi:hypothetical protein
LLIIGVLLLCGCFGREKPSLKSKDPALLVPAIKTAVSEHDPHACAELVANLDNDDPAVRFYAAEGLHRLTGETFGYRYYYDEYQRRPSIARWKQWLASQGVSTTAPNTTGP